MCNLFSSKFSNKQQNEGYYKNVGASSAPGIQRDLENTNCTYQSGKDPNFFAREEFHSKLCPKALHHNQLIRIVYISKLEGGGTLKIHFNYKILIPKKKKTNLY